MAELSLKKSFYAHAAPINVLALSNDGTLLLTGADDGTLLIWNVGSSERVQEISCVFHGAVNAACWVDLGQGDNLSFVLGCSDGNLQLFQRTELNANFENATITMAHPAIVEDIRFDKHHGRIASVGGGTAELWKVIEDGSLQHLIVDFPRQEVAVRTVHFCDEGASILICCCESHQVFYYEIEPWTLKWMKQISTRIGYAVLNSSEDALFVSNLVNGVDQYKFPSLVRARSYTYPIIHNQIMQVATLGTQFVVGGDDSFARVFDTSTGRLLDRLSHSHTGMLVQAVITWQHVRESMVVTASTGHGPSEVNIWIKERTSKVETTSIVHTSWLQLLLVAFLGALFASLMGTKGYALTLGLLSFLTKVSRAVFDVAREAM